MKQPNILFIMSDDHAAHAMSCYHSRINHTPGIDRIATKGMRFDNCFCTNSICTPSRAAILTGTYNHVNKVTTLATMMDNRLQTFPKLLQQGGYQTAVVGKWHLGQGQEHGAPIRAVEQRLGQLEHGRAGARAAGLEHDRGAGLDVRPVALRHRDRVGDLAAVAAQAAQRAQGLHPVQ